MACKQTGTLQDTTEPGGYNSLLSANLPLSDHGRVARTVPRRETLFRFSPKVVEAAGVEPASENVTGQENYMRSPVHALGITRGRSRLALRTDKKRAPLA
jgi:hypothetical protein